LTLSAREDWLDTRNFTAKVTDKAFTWRAGLNYVLDSGLAPYAAYSTRFCRRRAQTSTAIRSCQHRQAGRGGAEV